MLLFACPLAAAQQTAPTDARWSASIRFGNVSGNKVECHPRQYFSDNWKQFNYGGDALGPYPTLVMDEALSRRVGEIDGGEQGYASGFRLGEGRWVRHPEAVLRP